MSETCATFLARRLSATPDAETMSGAFTAAFGLLGGLHVILFLATLRPPWLVPRAGPVSAPAAAASRWA